MRRWFPVLALAGSAAIAGTARAEMTFVPGPPVPVSQAPQFIAKADFNGDGREDLAVSSPSSSKVSVLLSDEDFSFKTAIDFSVGKTCRALAVGHLVDKNIWDIAVVAGTSSVAGRNQVFIVHGKGDGTFNPPIPIELGRITAEGVAIGDFNGDGRDDIVVGSAAKDSVLVLLNQGQSHFSVSNWYQVGKAPKLVAVGDLDGNGLPDIVTVNTGSSGADDVSVMLNKAVGFSDPTNFLVGVGANAIALVDVDYPPDNAKDVVVLNAGRTLLQNVFSVSVLRNRTKKDAHGNPVGTGFFDVLDPVVVNCPTTLGGVAINCTPNGLAVGDFNGDGLVDFVVSFTTVPLIQGLPATAGLVAGYAGRGNGTFDFATQVSVGLKPQGLIAGDFTGHNEHVDDVGVAESGSQTVRFLRSLAPAKKANGNACLSDGQCESDFCVNDFCCNGSQVEPAVHSPSDSDRSLWQCKKDDLNNSRRCDILESLGECTALGQDGARCDLAAQCGSGFCVDGSCCDPTGLDPATIDSAAPSCPAGLFCNTGQCGLPAATGTACQDRAHGAQCASDHCVDGFCCSTATCPEPERCNIPNLEGTCSPPLVPGQSCTTSAQCDTNQCIDGVCCQLDPDACPVGQTCNACPAGQSCNLPGLQGHCAPIPTPSPTLTRTPTPTLTPTPQPNGAPCDNRVQCLSNYCVDGTCCGPAGLDATGEACLNSIQRCDIPGSAGTCADKLTGSTCTLNAQCMSNYCLGPNGECSTRCDDKQPGTCQAAPTGTPTATPTPVPGGGPCTATAQCQAPLLCNTAEGVCCEQADACQPGYSCRVPGSPGQCAALPTPTPTKVAIGKACTGGGVCGTGICTDGVCCDSETCPEPQRCDMPGYKGSCHDLLSIGDPCELTAQCGEGQVCINGVCSPPPSPTPSFIPISPPTLTPAPTIITHSSGGCSVGGGSDGAAAWMLGFVPFVLWLRRFGWERSRHK